MMSGMGNVYVRAGLTSATLIAVWLNILAYDQHVHSIDYYWMTYVGAALLAVAILAALVALFGLVRRVSGANRDPDK
jgi:hypothetical protein